MSEAAKSLAATLLALPLADRIALADVLVASIPDRNGALVEATPEFDAELDRRRAAHESGEEPGVLAEEFFRNSSQGLTTPGYRLPPFQG